MKCLGGESDPYINLGTGVLRNLLGLSDQASLNKTESSLTFLRSAELRERPVIGAFDLAYLQQIHKRLFGDVYEWAGQTHEGNGRT